MYNKISNSYIDNHLKNKDLKEIKELEIYKRLPYGLGKSKLNKEELIYLIKEYINLCKKVENLELKIVDNNLIHHFNPRDFKKLEKICKINIIQKYSKNNKKPTIKEQKEVKKSIIKGLLNKLNIFKKKNKT
jgi:hypothetical protein